MERSNTGLLLSLYQNMQRVRSFGIKKCRAPASAPASLGSLCLDLGQEAIGSAVGPGDEPEDVLIPITVDTARSYSAAWDARDSACYWGGDERGSAWEKPRGAEDFSRFACLDLTPGLPRGVWHRDPFRIVSNHGGGGDERPAATAQTTRANFLESLNLAGWVATAGGVRH